MTRPDLLFRAFADQTRLRVLHLLAIRKELCVCDLMRVLRLPQSKVSRHLAYLRRAGLVTIRESGRWSYYSLLPSGSALHRRLIACAKECFGDVPALRRDRQRIVGQRSPAQCR